MAQLAPEPTRRQSEDSVSADLSGGRVPTKALKNVGFLDAARVVGTRSVINVLFGSERIYG